MDKTTSLSGSSASIASPVIDIAGVTSDFSLRLQVKGPAQGQALLSLQCSTEGFVTQVRTLAVVHLTGDAPTELTWRAYQLPVSQFGHAGAKLRFLVEQFGTPGQVS